jgi:precorrin-6B methylase 2
MAWPHEPSEAMLLRVLRYLGQWRAIMLANTQVLKHGASIYGGPFKGMAYVGRPSEGALMPRLLGCYESELHPHLDRLLARQPEQILDIGCAEGYYAVGLARRALQATIHAFDTDPAAREACADLALRNEVEARVKVGGLFEPTAFESFRGRRTLVIVDTEGAEVDILQPALSPALAGMAIVVETHDLHRKGALATLVERFAETHEIVRVDQQPKTVEFPPWMRDLTHLDQLLAVWEWRVKPTPWLVMTPPGW